MAGSNVSAIKLWPMRCLMSELLHKRRVQHRVPCPLIEPKLPGPPPLAQSRLEIPYSGMHRPLLKVKQTWLFTRSSIQRSFRIPLAYFAGDTNKEVTLRFLNYDLQGNLH